MKSRFGPLAAVFLVCACGISTLAVQPLKQVLPTADRLKDRYEGGKKSLILVAERMPEADYGFRPMPTMEMFAERIAHVADHNFEGCQYIVEKPNPYKGVKFETRFTKRDELLAVLKESFAYCDLYFSRLSPEVLSQKIAVPAPPGASFKEVQVELGVGAIEVVTHNHEMYGYLAVYLRLKGLVPPSSSR